MMEHKRYHPEAIDLKAPDDAGHFTAAFASLDVIDHDGDLTRPGAIGEQDVRILIAHDWDQLMVGKGRTREVGGRVLVEGTLNLDLQTARDLRAALRFDLEHTPPLQEWSYGFRIEESHEETREGHPVRVLDRLAVAEVSPVVLGAGIATGTLAAKALRWAYSGVSLADHVGGIAAEIDALAARLEDVAQKRAADQRTLGRESLAALRPLIDRLTHLAHRGEAMAASLDEIRRRSLGLVCEYVVRQARIARP